MDWFHTKQARTLFKSGAGRMNSFALRCCVTRVPVKTSRSRLVCQRCKHQASVTAGTLFDKTRTPRSMCGWPLPGVSPQSKSRRRCPGTPARARSRELPGPGGTAFAGHGSPWQRERLNRLVEGDETFIAVDGKVQAINRGSGTPAHVSMPGVHRAALVHRWWLGTHQGAVRCSGTAIAVSLYFALTGANRCHAECFFTGCWRWPSRDPSGALPKRRCPIKTANTTFCGAKWRRRGVIPPSSPASFVPKG